MPNVLYVDTYEPENIAKALGKVAPAVQVGLNNDGKADYYWLNLKDKQVMYERKQLGEALSDLDRLEEQLYRHLVECDELSLIVEGVGKATQSGVQIYKQGRWGWNVKGGHSFGRQPGLWARWESLKWSLWHECGVYVVEVSDWEQTVWHLNTAFKQTYRPEHTTLKRYTVPHIGQMSKNKHIDNLMRLHGCRVGEANAKRLVERFGSVRGVMQASEAELIGCMGGAWTANFMQTISKED